MELEKPVNNCSTSVLKTSEYQLNTADFHFQKGVPFVTLVYEGVSKSLRTKSISKCMLTFGITRWKTTQRVMVAKLTRLTHDKTAPNGRELYHLQFSL
jgi:hypothetical protein